MRAELSGWLWDSMFQTATAVCMFEEAWHPIACLLM